MEPSSSENDNERVDLDKYRKNYESDEHWILRKSFMARHWNSFPEDDILCLAQVFTNTEFLGCKYPPETMQRVALLAQEVPEIKAYRATRRHRLKRTFIGAQDAVQAKIQKIDASKKRQKLEANDWTPEDRASITSKSILSLTETQKSENFRHLLRDVIFFDLGNAIDENASLNKTTATMQKIGSLQMKFEPDDKTFYYIFRGQIIAEGSGDSKKTAKKNADDNLVSTLKTNCYTIKTKLQYYSAEDVIMPGDKNPGGKKDSTKLQENNLGFKMLKMLGWSGGSLGCRDGIVDPVNLEIKIGRAGLGAEGSDFNVNAIKKLLRNFKENQVEYDLVFSKEFTKDERSRIHQIAQSLGLNTKSYGKNESRHIVISTKISPLVLRQKLIEGDNQYLQEKYELIPPTKTTNELH